MPSKEKTKKSEIANHSTTTVIARGRLSLVSSLSGLDIMAKAEIEPLELDRFHERGRRCLD